jgi:hypothetical protein
MFRLEDRGPEALVIPGLAKSKARPFASPCPKNNTIGSRKRSLTGVRCRKPSGKCNDSVVRNFLNSCQIPDGVKSLAKKSSDWFNRYTAAEAEGKCHPRDLASDNQGFHGKGNTKVVEENHYVTPKKPLNITAKM